MKRFEFRLERVLDWRRSQLDIELAELSRFVMEAQAIDRRREQVEAEREAAERSLVESTSVEAQQLSALDGFRTWAHHERERLLRQRAQLENRIAAQRQRVIDARRAFRLLEHLREKRQSEWAAEFTRELENLSGELYLARRVHSSARPATAARRVGQLNRITWRTSGN